MALTLFSLCKSCRSLKLWKGSRQRPEGTCFDPPAMALQTCSQDCEQKNESFEKGKEVEGGEDFRRERGAVLRNFDRL